VQWVVWLLGFVWVAIIFATVWWYGSWEYSRALKALAKRRPSPAHEEFLSALAKDCESDVAEFL
jgi:hypothetical protein